MDGSREDYYRQVMTGLPPLQKLMLDLDVAVTGVPPERAVSQYHHMPETLEDWLAQPGGNPMWYLADSGYSRVVWSTDTGNLFLTYNSTSKAKENWNKALPQREALTKYLKAEYERLLGHAREWRESKAQVIVNDLLEMQWDDRPPLRQRFDDRDQEIEVAARQPFTALDYALAYGHHPKLWAVVKGSVFEPQYRKRFKISESSGPKLKVLKDHRVDLDPKERKEVVRRGAVWDDGKPGVWKSVVNGKTYFVCNTHRAAQIKPTLKGAIRAFKFIKTTS